MTLVLEGELYTEYTYEDRLISIDNRDLQDAVHERFKEFEKPGPKTYLGGSAYSEFEGTFRITIERLD